MIGFKINVKQKPGSDPEVFKRQSEQILTKLPGMLQNLQGETYKKLINDFLDKTGFSPEGRRYIDSEIASLENCSQPKRHRTVMLLIIANVVNCVTQITGQTNDELMEEISPGVTKHIYDVVGLEEDGTPTLKKQP